MATTFSSRTFNQDASRAKRAARQGPVFITERGRPSHVLLTVEDYWRLSGGGTSIVDQLAMSTDVEFDPPRAGSLARAADLP
jgi:prevent-host-death family protein